MAETGERHSYPRRLHHETPGWVKSGAIFHVRLRAVAEAPSRVRLTDAAVANGLLAAARNCHERRVWHCALMLLMPDHLHALPAFPAQASMNRTVGAWKRYASRALGVEWQPNFFDHRIRNDDELAQTWRYVLRNPVVKGLCASEADWPWAWPGA